VSILACYHKDDLDGACSAAIINKKTNCNILGVTYSEEFDLKKLNDISTLYFLDFCPKINILFNIIKKFRGKIIIIDHHLSAYQNYLQHSQEIVELCGSKVSLEYVFDNDFSGCELTYKYFYSDTIPYGVKLLGRYDIWDHYSDNVLNFQYGIRSIFELDEENILNFQKEEWGYIIDEDLSYIKYIIDIGCDIQRYHINTSKNYAKSYSFRYYKWLGEYNCIILNRGSISSLDFESVYDSDKDDIMVSFVKGKNGWNFSLRSIKDEVDCAKIAKEFGGGGHKKAAGFSVQSLQDAQLFF